MDLEPSLEFGHRAWGVVCWWGVLVEQGGGTREGIWGRKESDFIHIVFRYIPSTHVLFVIMVSKITKGKPHRHCNSESKGTREGIWGRKEKKILYIT